MINQDSTSYPDNLLLIDLNIWYQKVATMILEAQDNEDWDDGRNTTNYPIYTTPLVANQRDYSIPASLKILKHKRIDITYDGVTYYRASPIDSTELTFGLGPPSDSAMETTIDNRFSRNAPIYDIKYGSIFIYPRASTADVAAGAAMVTEWSRQVTEFTTANLSDATVSPGFDEPFHVILAYGPAYEYAQAHELPQELAGDLKDYEARLKQHYGNKDKDRIYQMKGDFDDYGAGRVRGPGTSYISRY